MKRKVRVEVVAWFDCSNQRGELHMEEISEGIILISVGHLIKETDDVVCIGQDWLPSEQTWRWVASIPKRCIVDRKTFLKTVDDKGLGS